MMPAELELSRSPAFQITYRFLITGPVAGALSAAVMLIAGPDLLNAIRSTYMIGALHIILIGFINLTMMGALHQFIPVLSGRPIPGSRWIFQTIYLFSIIGLFLFVTGMFRQIHIAILAGASCILCGHALFLGSSLYTLAGIARTDATLYGIRCSLYSFTAGNLLAGALAFEHGSGIYFHMHSSIRYLHIYFMSVGWVGLLIVAISIQVLPMFYVTREHLHIGGISYIRSLFALTVAHAILLLIRPYANKLEFIINSAQSSVLIFLMCAGLLYCTRVLRALMKSNRPHTDVTVRFWQIGLSMLALALLFGIVRTICVFLVPMFNRTNYDITALIVALDRFILPVLILPIACVLSIIQAMLFKIVPFLTWLHLFQSGFGSAPHVRAQIPGRLIQLQVLLFLLSLLGLILSLVNATTWYRPAMVMLILNWSWLFGLLLRPGWIYFRIKNQEAST